MLLCNITDNRQLAIPTSYKPMGTLKFFEEVERMGLMRCSLKKSVLEIPNIDTQTKDYPSLVQIIVFFFFWHLLSKQRNFFFGVFLLRVKGNRWVEPNTRVLCILSEIVSTWHKCFNKNLYGQIIILWICLTYRSFTLSKSVRVYANDMFLLPLLPKKCPFQLRKFHRLYNCSRTWLHQMPLKPKPIFARVLNERRRSAYEALNFYLLFLTWNFPKWTAKFERLDTQQKKGRVIRAATICTFA